MPEPEAPVERALTAALWALHREDFRICLDATAELGPQRAQRWGRDPRSGSPVRVHVEFGQEGYRLRVQEAIPGAGLHTRVDEHGGWAERDPPTVATHAIMLAANLETESA